MGVLRFRNAARREAVPSLLPTCVRRFRIRVRLRVRVRVCVKGKVKDHLIAIVNIVEVVTSRFGRDLWPGSEVVV